MLVRPEPELASGDLSSPRPRLLAWFARGWRVVGKGARRLEPTNATTAVFRAPAAGHEGLPQSAMSTMNRHLQTRINSVGNAVLEFPSAMMSVTVPSAVLTERC
jgi:hypothetical protein